VVMGAKRYFTFGKRKESAFLKRISYIEFIIYVKKEDSSVGTLVFEDPPLKYIAFLNIYT